ncbi:hypothetical protein FRC02_002777 [Tulasnella sp. 418]|nr:hypothetical protein FRC02_002777 [Tulasnella sp. 418]
MPQLTSTHSSGTRIYNTLTTAAKSSLSSSSASLSFHARNIPTISIDSYLMRILKYCPTTSEVFLSLLVYFDRTGKLGDAVKSDLGMNYGGGSEDNVIGGGGGIVIDSYNVHRLIIAGVSGLPQSELNQLFIPLEELQRYADQLRLYPTTLPLQQCSIRSSASRRRFAFQIEPVPIVGHPPPHYAPQHYVSSPPTTRADSSRDPPPSSYHPAQPSSSSSQIRRTPILSEGPNITVPPPLQHAPNSYSSSTSDGSNSTNTFTAPTPTSSTSTITQTKPEGGNPSESSLVSTPTSTSISFVDTEERMQVDEDRDQDDDQR